MKLKDLRKIENLSRKLNQTIPPEHPKAYDMLSATRTVHEAMDGLLELAKLEAVADYINEQPEAKRDTKALSKMQGYIKLHKGKLEAVEALEKEMIDISVKLQIEETAKKAGAINPELISLFIEKTTELRHDIDNDGNVTLFIDGRTPESFITDMPYRNDTQHLFDSDIKNSSSGDTQTYKGVNPWKPETKNLTEQCRIYKRDKALAKRLQEEAKPKPVKGANPFLKETENLTEQGRLLRSNRPLYDKLRAQAGLEPLKEMA